MHQTSNLKLAAALICLSVLASAARAFEGRITAASTRDGQTTPLLYTVGTNALRIEVAGSDRPNPVDVLNLDTGAMTLVFPHNRSFVRLPQETASPANLPPGFPPPAGQPPRSAPQANLPSLPAIPNDLPPGTGPTNLPGMPAPPPIPTMPMPGEALELRATGEKTNLLGYACEKFELKQRGEIMEIWAAEGLLPFRNYTRNQPLRFGPQMIEEKWGDLVRAKKRFPLLAVLKLEGGGERLRFEATSIKPEKIEDPDGTLFQPPADYHELEPLPF